MALLKKWRPWASGPAIPDALWQQVLHDYGFLAQRPPAQQQRLRELAQAFLRSKEFTGARGFVITDEVAVTVASQAVLPVLHWGLQPYDDFVGIVIHAQPVVARRRITDEAGVVHTYNDVLAGEAMDGGPVMLSWSEVSDRSAQHAGCNLVIHEFVHKLDLRDGRADGCPPLPNRAAWQAWQDVMQREYAAFREQVLIAQRFSGAPPWLDAYGATAVDEFFAVAAEAYFTQPLRFAQDFAALAAIFDGFFGCAAPVR